jgi:hypothetical protein
MQSYTPKPKGFWSFDKGKNMRAFLASLAEKMGFDPLVADDWYSVSRQEFIQYRVLFYFVNITTANKET